MCICEDCGSILGHEVLKGRQVEVVKGPTNKVNFPILVVGTEITVDGERIIGVRSPHNGLRGLTNIRLNAPEDMTEGDKILKVNVPHEVSSDKKRIKLTDRAGGDVRPV